jgi:hypothetical protein
MAILVAALWLTPILNAERISARDQLARLDAGTTEVERLDVAAIRGWGHPGQEVLELLAVRAKEPGQEALAARLAGTDVPGGTDVAVVAEELAALMPVQPAGAVGTRATLLAGADAFLLRDWAEVCRRNLDGQPGCLMAVADLLPARPGEEAILLLFRDEAYAELIGLYLDDAGRLATRAVQRVDGQRLGAAEARALLDGWLAAPPPLTAAPINQLGTGEDGLLFLP